MAECQHYQSSDGETYAACNALRGWTPYWSWCHGEMHLCTVYRLLNDHQMRVASLEAEVARLQTERLALRLALTEAVGIGQDKSLTDTERRCLLTHAHNCWHTDEELFLQQMLAAHDKRLKEESGVR